MFKKAAQIAVVFSLLAGAYVGYTHAFGVVVDLIGQTRKAGDSTPFPEYESNSTLRSRQLAIAKLGASHWAANQLKMQYYDSGRGSYMYAQDYLRSDEGKVIKVWPFVMISDASDGKSCKIVTSDVAIIKLNQPFGMVKTSNEPSKVIEATLSGNVLIRDDKGTQDDNTDDLLVGPLDSVAFADKTLQITTDSEVIIQDRDMTITGLGMMIQLRRKITPPPIPGEPAPPSGGGGGFEAETATLWKNVHIVIKDVTSGGVLPGKSKPDTKGRTPLDLRSDQKMVVELAQPQPMLIGPPDPRAEPEPTFAHFYVNVRVLRGTTTPDQLNCDVLHLTLAPDRKPDGTSATPAISTIVAATPVITPGPAKPPTPAAGGPLTELKLRRALAEGHAVWLQSESQGLRARCRELVYEKNSVKGQPDKTFLNGGPGMQLNVEKVEYATRGENIGNIDSVRTLKAIDATIFDYGPDSSRIISRGPGKMEERPARNASVDRTVFFEDEMEMWTWREANLLPPANPSPGLIATSMTTSAGTTEPAKGLLRRKITLTGPSKLIDIKGNATLDARQRIIAEFESAAKTDGKTGDGPAVIKNLKAFEDVHLTNGSKILTARQQLDAVFEEPEVILVAAPTPSNGSIAAPASPNGSPLIASATPSPTSAPASQPPAEKPPEPVEPAVDGRADKVYATILQAAGANGKGELKDAKLRGGVMVHQDPGPGELTGKNAFGEALDLFSQGKGLMRFIVASDEPQAVNSKAKLAGLGGNGNGTGTATTRDRPPLRTELARVELDNKTIEGPLIGLDQKANYAWVQGPGNYYQMTERGLLDDKGLEPPKDPNGKPLGAGTKDRMVITWNGRMDFFGVNRDLLDRPAAKIEFRGVSEEVRTPDGKVEFRRGVQAKQTDSASYSDSMDVYMDKPIILSKLTGTKPSPNSGSPAEPEAQIAMVDWRGDSLYADGLLKYAGVDITSQKRYPGTNFIREKQRIRHTHVAYDKRTGDFEAPGAGIVYLYQAEEKWGKKDRSVKPTAMAVSSTPSTTNARTSPDATRPAVAVFTPKFQLPLKLTRVSFTEGMRGKFGVAKDKDDRQTRQSTFVGSTQAVNVLIEPPTNDVDLDRLEKWPDFLKLTSDILDVESIPSADDPKKANQRLKARGNSLAQTIDTTIAGDRITYDSATELCYVYGDDNKEVVLEQQKSAGQPMNTTRGRAARYNKTTREGEILDPQAIQFFDLKTATRPKPFYPDLGGSPKPFDPIKAKRMPFARPARNSTERNPFTGH